MGEGLRPALDPALRVLRALSSGDKETERQESERLLEVLPNPACRDLLLVALMASAKIKPGKKWKPPRGPELLSGTAQALALLDEVGGPLLLPEDWTLALLKELKKSGKAAASSDLKRIAGVASQLETPKPTELAYACTRIGLSRRDQELPGFLLLRARQLDYWDVDRLINCLRMTHELARRRQDQALLEEIREVALEICPEAFEGPENPIMVPLSESELSSLLKQEQAAPRQRYPSLKRPGRETLAPFLRYLIEGDDDGDEEECDCPACRARRSGGNHFDDLDEFEDEMDPFDFLEAVLPRPRAPSGAERKNLKQKRKNAKRTRQANRKKKKK
jgi:hypothetical protein